MEGRCAEAGLALNGWRLLLNGSGDWLCLMWSWLWLMVLLVLQLQPQWLCRTKLPSFLGVLRVLAAGLLGLLLAVFLLLLVRHKVLVFGLLLAFVAGLPRRLLVLGLG